MSSNARMNERVTSNLRFANDVELQVEYEEDYTDLSLRCVQQSIKLTTYSQDQQFKNSSSGDLQKQHTDQHPNCKIHYHYTSKISY